jgi:hypothetical protein
MRIFSPRAVTDISLSGIHALGARAKAPRAGLVPMVRVDVFCLFPELDLRLFGDLSNNLTVW